MEIREKHFRLLVYLCTCVLVTLLLSGCEWYKNFLGDREHNNMFDPVSPEYKTINYFPLKVGLTWIYKVTVVAPSSPPAVIQWDEKDEVTKITKSIKVNGVTYYYIENFPDPNLKGYIGKNSLGDIISYNPDTEETRVVYNFSEGISDFVKKNHFTTTWIVPAGKFENCFVFSFSESGKYSQTLWFDFEKGLIVYSIQVYDSQGKVKSTNKWYLKNLQYDYSLFK